MTALIYTLEIFREKHGSELLAYLFIGPLEENRDRLCREQVSIEPIHAIDADHAERIARTLCGRKHARYLGLVGSEFPPAL